MSKEPPRQEDASGWQNQLVSVPINLAGRTSGSEMQVQVPPAISQEPIVGKLSPLDRPLMDASKHLREQPRLFLDAPFVGLIQVLVVAWRLCGRLCRTMKIMKPQKSLERFRAEAAVKKMLCTHQYQDPGCSCLWGLIWESSRATQCDDHQSSL